MFLVNTVDEGTIFREGRTCIARRGDWNLASICPAGTGTGENRSMAGITPAEQDFAKIGRAHLSIY
jgi:hypothetical protein